MMGLTAYAQEEKAKREAWHEMGKLRKRIAELEKALATSFEFLSFSRLSDCVFYENHKHLIKEQE